MSDAAPTRVLFGETLECADIARVLSTDGKRYTAAAYVVLGIEAKWLAGAEELFWLDARFQRDGHDRALLEPLFEILAERIHVLPDRAAKRDLLFRHLFRDQIGNPLFERAAGIGRIRLALMLPHKAREIENAQWLEKNRSSEADRRANDPRWRSRLGPTP